MCVIINRTNICSHIIAMVNIQYHTQVMIAVCLCACLLISSRGTCLYISHKNTLIFAETELPYASNVAAISYENR
jgi:hypothetical protein